MNEAEEREFYEEAWDSDLWRYDMEKEDAFRVWQARAALEPEPVGFEEWAVKRYPALSELQEMLKSPKQLEENTLFTIYDLQAAYERREG